MSIDREMKKPLTKRESLVIRKFESGKKLTEIADEISLSTNTVKTYRQRALNKLNAVED